jgi:hypothetical protein
MTWWFVGLVAFYAIFFTEAIYAMANAPEWTGPEF